ncbi:MAG: hypothetical protein L0154_00640 [Chloroflexi bacterium]|nr:hypothetical protein [Chloroflexota bacterium]
MSDNSNFDDMPLPDWLQGGSFEDDEKAKKPPPKQDETPEVLPDWLTADAAPSDEPLDAGDFTSSGAGYGEDGVWREEEELAEPELELPSLEDLTGGVGDTKAQGADYVPDWFLGLEEQNLEEAPDWVQSTSSVSIDDLTDTSAFEAEVPSFESLGMSSQPETTAAQDEEVPDWFASRDAVPDLDFDAAVEEEEEPDWFAGEVEAEPLPDLSMAEEDVLEDVFSDLDLDEEEDIFTFAESDEVEEADAFYTMGGVEDEVTPVEEKPVFQAPQADLSWLDEIERGSSPAIEEDVEEEEFALPELSEEAELAESEFDFLGEAEEGELDFATELDLEDLGFGDEAIEEEAEDVGVFDFGFDIDSKEMEDQLDTASDESLKVERGGTQKLIKDMQTSSLDIEQLLAFEAEQEGAPPPEERGLTALPHTSSLELASEDLFSGLDEDLFESLDPPVGGEGPSLSIAGEDDLDLFGVREQGTPEPRPETAAPQLQPDWIADLRPDVPVNIRAGNLEFEMEQTKIADMPEALRALRERSAALSALSQAEQTQQASPASGPLAGIVGGLGVTEIAEDLESDFQVGAALRVAESQRRQIEFLESALSVVRREAAARREGQVVIPEAVKVRTRARPKLDRIVVSLILLALLIAPFITDGLHLDAFEAPGSDRLLADQRAVHEAVDTLEAGDYVLISFDYGPTAARELNPLAEAVIRDIIKQGGIPLLTGISPLGVLNSRSVLNDLAQDETLLTALNRDDALQPREDYVALNYIPGEAVGIRSLTRSELAGTTLFEVDSEGEETGLNIGELHNEDVAFIVVIGETLDDARRWAEQLNDDDIQKYLLTTAAAEPLIQAYVDDDLAYQGYLAGYRDTYSYNIARNPEALTTDPDSDFDLPNSSLGRWYSLTMGILAVLGFMVLGLIVNLVRRRR